MKDRIISAEFAKILFLRIFLLKKIKQIEKQVWVLVFFCRYRVFFEQILTQGVLSLNIWRYSNSKMVIFDRIFHLTLSTGLLDQFVAIQAGSLVAFITRIAFLY